MLPPTFLCDATVANTLFSWKILEHWKGEIRAQKPDELDARSIPRKCVDQQPSSCHTCEGKAAFNNLQAAISEKEWPHSTTFKLP